MSTAILIKTYRKDFTRIYMLLESITRYNQDSLPVYLVIPERDMRVFRKPCLENLVIVAEEALVLEKYSLRSTYEDNFIYSRIRRLRGVDKIGHRTCYRGALVQQLCKLALPLHFKETIQNVIILDSDVVFIRPFRESDFLANNRPELIAIPTQWEPESALHQWIVDAQRFLGLPHAPEESNWIAHGTCWRTEVLDLLINYIQDYHQRHWQEALMEYPYASKFQDHGFFSEFQLYGVFHKHLSSYQQAVVSQPKIYNIWNRYDFERFGRIPETELKGKLKPFLLFGLQKDYASQKLRKRTVQKVQKIVNASS